METLTIETEVGLREEKPQVSLVKDLTEVEVNGQVGR